MFGHQFYHNTLRKYIIIFGTLFNDIIIDRKDKNGNTVQRIKVPLAYAPKEKYLARLDAQPNLDERECFWINNNNEKINLNQLRTILRKQLKPIGLDLKNPLNLKARWTKDTKESK